MKNSLFLLGAAAVVALSSCTKNEVLEVAESRAISFNGTGIDNITRNDITSTGFNQFNVYGGYGKDNTIFDGRSVTKSPGWQYSPTEYWVAGTWNFGAYAVDGTSGVTPTWNYTNGLTLEVVSDMTNQGDLVYADAENIPVTKGEDGNLQGTQVVSLNFTHLLSKIQFSFTKSSDLSGQQVTISDFTISGINTKCTWTKGVQGSSNTPVNFTDAMGDELSEGEGTKTTEFYVIPQTVGENFTITAKVLVQDNAGTTIKNGTITAKLDKALITEWGAQNRYIYSSSISIDDITDSNNPNPKPIVFSGSAEDWSVQNHGGITIQE